MKKKMGVLVSSAVVSMLLVSGSALAASIEVTVSGQCNPWLAGMPAGSDLPDAAPGQSPILVDLPIAGGDVLTFDFLNGGVSNWQYGALSGPDGVTSSVYSHNGNGFSTTAAPVNSLMGVFLSDQQDPTAVVAGLNFEDNLDFLSLAPELQQVFFVGDGLANGTTVQQFIAPTNASRLFLGTMDSNEWINNIGSFNVVVNSSSESVPEPNTLLMFGVSLFGLLGLRRKK